MSRDNQQSPGFDANVLRIHNIGRQFGDKTVWVDAVDIPRGKVVSIIGASGSGKSTLLHIIGGLSRPNFRRERNVAAGSVREPILEAIFSVDGKFVHYDLRKAASPDFKNRIGFVFQSPYLLQSATASANIALGAYSARRLISSEAMQGIAEQLKINENFLSDRSNIRSGGERQRIALARALARSPNLILADEPTANLDPKLAEETVGFLREWSDCEADRTTIWVTHDVRLAATFSDVVVVMNGGRLGEWTTWPQDNPRDPLLLRAWIDGEPTSSRSVSARVSITAHNKVVDAVSPFSQSVPMMAANVWQRITFWIKIGVAQVFDGSDADQISLLRQWTSVAVRCEPAVKQGQSNSLGVLARWWKSFNAKESVVWITLLITLVVALWTELDALTQSIQNSLLTPTLNPVVISSRATIDDDAVHEAQQLLTTRHEEVSNSPDAFGRYEFDHRRVSLPRANPGLNAPPEYCSLPQNRADREVLLDIAAINPSEPLLKRLTVEPSPRVPAHRAGIVDRFDGLWSIWLWRGAQEKLVGILGAPLDLSLVCMEVRGSWITAEVTGLMTETVRGRFGPYDVIMSGTQWRDFGSARDRDYYQSVAMYFYPEPWRSRELVENVRARASEIFDPPNTRLIQSLANEAAFERISAALERNLYLKIIIGFLGSAALVFLGLVVYGFVSDNFQKNLKSICVALTFGAGFSEIAIVQVTRIAIIAAPAAILSGLTILGLFGFDKYRAGGRIYPESQTLWTGSDFLTRFFLLPWAFIAGVLALTIAVSGWWVMYITRRSLTDQLKELD
jgi:ABC-type lipoprotein export system ATPase subunit